MCEFLTDACEKAINIMMIICIVYFYIAYYLVKILWSIKYLLLAIGILILSGKILYDFSYCFYNM